jgi:HSP90 family molecular chaperone
MPLLFCQKQRTYTWQTILLQLLEEEEAEPKTRTETKTVWFWEHMNDQPAIWTRSKSEVTDEEYIRFFKGLRSSKYLFYFLDIYLLKKKH